MSAQISPNEVLNSPRVANKGLLYINEADERVLIENFNALTEPDGPAIPATVFNTKSYYIGKQLIESLFAFDFADFEGIQLSFGREPDEAGGRLVLIMKGMYQQKSDEEADNFKFISRTDALATYGPIIDGPGGVVPIIRNPPFFDGDDADSPRP